MGSLRRGSHLTGQLHLITHFNQGVASTSAAWNTGVFLHCQVSFAHFSTLIILPFDARLKVPRAHTSEHRNDAFAHPRCVPFNSYQAFTHPVCLRLHCPPADEILEASEGHTISRLLDCGGHSRRRRRPTFYSFSQRTRVGTRAGWGLEWKMKLGI
ncbi:hypothetical protein C8R47DRAFT_1088837 [Mycena vitilis]|nr:hypothetical protein C8R47DRAFT_1088837 [Mycena vitilis]